MISILIVVSWNGHHPSYCAEQIRACDAFSHKIYVLCPHGANPVERVGGPSALTEKIKMMFHTNRAARTGFKKYSDLAADLRELRSQVDSIREANPTEKMFIFHTSLDSLFVGVLHLPVLAFYIRELFPSAFSGLIISPDRRWPLNRARQALARQLGNSGFAGLLHRSCENMLDGAAFLLRHYYLWQRDLLLKRSCCETIAIQDERYAERIQLKTGKPVALYPETTSVQVSNPPPDLVRMIFERKQGRMVVGLLGAVSRMKCLDLLLDVIQKYDTSDFVFVIAGNCQYGSLSVNHRVFLEVEIKKHNNVVFAPQSIPSEGDFNAIIENCDIVFCVYREHFHSSNIISKAAAFRKPVLVGAGDLMAKRVMDYSIGHVLQEQSAESCFMALQSMGTLHYRQNIQKTGKFEKYMEDHSFERLQKLMTALSLNNQKPREMSPA